MASSAIATGAMSAPAVRPAAEPSRAARMAGAVAKLLATVQIIWFYLARTQCEIKLPLYEAGLERTPFQYRLLLMLPLRWAHGSLVLNRAAQWLTGQPAWFPRGVRPEGMLEGAIDVACLVVTGCIVEKLYRRSSATGILAPYAYPLALAMVHSTYSLMTYHAYRFPADLPAMAFFAVGSYLIYIEAHPGWLALIFLVSTSNRETSLMLLLLFILARSARGSSSAWREAFRLPTFGVVAPLLAAWFAWHIWVKHHFAANALAGGPRLLLNLGSLAIPFSWPQLLAACGFLLPSLFLLRRRLRDPVLRSWLWLLPAWFACMLLYGLFVEIRIFGELIPYVACCCLLIAEDSIVSRWQAREANLKLPAGPFDWSGVRVSPRESRPGAKTQACTGKRSEGEGSTVSPCYDQRART